ncbi:hypothetical protein [Actinoplanes regularis]|uniref:hypothetical protein n=1 Tax=Actinoplanes regularis TaxID=52697 RepID=UPI0024A3EC2B|nr:hypothetical protein [Actinoplanes regularis]GLW32982.1 hypothetical protein Areg01_59200 [Actinoplanes regularis]
MSYSPHRQAALAVADRWMADPKLRKRIAYAYKLTRDQDPDHVTVIDMFGQPHRGWDAGQLFALACLDHLLVSGRLYVAEHPLGSTPLGDKHREANQNALADHLAPDSLATVDLTQRGAECDGLLTWKKPIPGSGAAGVVEIAPDEAPLEIGGTDASTTCLHLCRYGVTARWPYRQKTLWTLALQDREEIRSVRTGRLKTKDPVIDGLARFMNNVWWGWHNMGPAARMRGLAIGAPPS